MAGGLGEARGLVDWMHHYHARLLQDLAPLVSTEPQVPLIHVLPLCWQLNHHQCEPNGQFNQHLMLHK